MELAEKHQVYLPETVHWERDGIHLFLDPESPHWIATDVRGEKIMGWIKEGLPFGQLIQRYSSTLGLDTAYAWLHLHDFIQALLRVGFAAPQPVVPTHYLGRAAYARPTGLKELWFHTNNICNLTCIHCLVSSAPWVRDWGLPMHEMMRLIDEAMTLGVDRFYFTGGEPFMRKEMFDLIRAITETKRRELIILTNATLFKGQGAAALKTLDRERVRFQVSIDGASPATNDPIRGTGAFEAAVGGLRLLAELGFETSITTAVTVSNLKDLPGITELAHRLGVRTQHLMWLHRRGRVVSHESNLRARRKGNGAGEPMDPGFPGVNQLIEVVRDVKRTADAKGIAVDNYESIKRRVNGRPGVKYDLGNACWDSLCIYSDGMVYPSAALVNVKPLALGSVKGGIGLREIWELSPVAELFRQATVALKANLHDDPFRYLTGGGDLEHSFWFNLNGESLAAAMAPERITALLTGSDPYYSLYTSMIQDAMWDLARTAEAAVNRRSGYDAPRVLHAMGEGAIHCATDDLAVTGEVDIRTLHSNCVLAFDVDKPRKLVREFYGKAAQTPQAELCCPTQFDSALISHIPQEVIDRFYGCGSPVTFGDLQPGEAFVDLGSGAGIDCFIAAKLVGPTGRVIGIDMTDPMLKVANENRPIVAKNLGYDAAEFKKGFLEDIPVESKSVDLATSNCVINLSPDKPRVFAEIWRILKNHGRVVIADIVSDRPVPAQLKVNPQLWGECIVGALTEEELVARLEEAGFYGLSVLRKVYWKTVEGFAFYSVTVRGYKFEKTTGCRFTGQWAVYLGPMKSVIDEEGHLFPRNMAVEVCTDTAAKLANPPYAGSFAVLEPNASRIEITATGIPLKLTSAECRPGCC